MKNLWRTQNTDPNADNSPSIGIAGSRGANYGRGLNQHITGREGPGDPTRINQQGRADVTVYAPPSKKPPGVPNMSIHASSASTLAGSRPKMPVGVPLVNYAGLQQPASFTSQYSRSYNDFTPYTLRREQGDVSGVSNVQLRNPVAATSRKRIVLYSAAGYLWAVAPRIPGQTRDNFGGFHMRGIDPQTYNQLLANGPQAQPVNPGGPAKIAGKFYANPSMHGLGGPMNMIYGAGS